jgi:hypothetical protein
VSKAVFDWIDQELWKKTVEVGEETPSSEEPKMGTGEILYPEGGLHGWNWEIPTGDREHPHCPTH